MDKKSILKNAVYTEVGPDKEGKFWPEDEIREMIKKRLKKKTLPKLKNWEKHSKDVIDMSTSSKRPLDDTLTFKYKLKDLLK